MAASECEWRGECEGGADGGGERGSEAEARPGRQGARQGGRERSREAGREAGGQAGRQERGREGGRSERRPPSLLGILRAFLRLRHERPKPEGHLLPVLLAAVPLQHRGQNGLHPARGHVQLQC